MKSNNICLSSSTLLISLFVSSLTTAAVVIILSLLPPQTVNSLSTNSPRRLPKILTSSSSSSPITIALTREVGKNDKLLKTLESHPSFSKSTKINIIEIPCIKHTSGPDSNRLLSTLETNIHQYDYIIITSPEAASIFASAYHSRFTGTTTPSPPTIPPKIAAVGKATSQTLHSHNISVTFLPSKATAQTLCEELPPCRRVLYPASLKAADTIEKLLMKKGTIVDRLNTYDTVGNEFDEVLREQARRVDVVCFGSPSAVAAWMGNMGTVAKKVVAACIGETSAKACREWGWEEGDVYFPDKPGMEGWADMVGEAVMRVVIEKRERGEEEEVVVL